MTSNETHHRPCGLPTTESTKSFWHSEPSPLLQGHRTTRDLPEKTDVVIIGSGITGSSIAYHLFLDQRYGGSDIVMLEAREACWGATGRNGGHCQPLFFEHPEDPSIGHFEYRNYLTLASLIAQQNVDCEFVNQPSIRAIYNEALLKQAQEALDIMRTSAPDLAGMMHVVTSKDQLAQWRIPSACGALYTDKAARLWPYKLVAHILESLLQSTDQDGTFNLQTLTPVNCIEQHGSRWLVKTPRGCIDAGTVFLATNGYTSHLLHDFADLILPCRGQMSALVPSPSLSWANRIHTSMGFEGPGIRNNDYLIQNSYPIGEQLMFGGGRLLGPSIGITDDSIIDDNVATYLRTALPQYMDLQDDTTELKASHQWTGIMGWSKDGRPWIGRVPHRKNLYISAGYTGHGMPNAWLCGRAVAEMYLTSDESYDEAVKAAVKATGLPLSYVVTEDRIGRAAQIAEYPEPSTIARNAAD